VQASRQRIVAAGDAERRRLERNLHDGAQQRLVALSLSLRLAQSKLQADPEAANAVLEASREELAAALDELRELARGIHPAILTDRGLSAALDAVAARSPIPVELDITEEPLPEPVGAAAYYVIAEALANVVKYARASEVKVRVGRDDECARISVEDDGVGGADARDGSGLRGLADRVAALEGTLEVHSPPGGGTRITAEIPLQLEQER
jgi:signal transduction histidine kinase